MHGFPRLPGAAAFLGFPALRWFKRAAWHAGRRGAEIRARTWLKTSLAGLLAPERARASRKETRDKRRDEERRAEERCQGMGREGKGRLVGGEGVVAVVKEGKRGSTCTRGGLQGEGQKRRRSRRKCCCCCCECELGGRGGECWCGVQVVSGTFNPGCRCDGVDGNAP